MAKVPPVGLLAMSYRFEVVMSGHGFSHSVDTRGTRFSGASLGANNG